MGTQRHEGVAPGDVGRRGDATARPADKYAIGFLPRENGVHSIDLRFNGRHVPGSPFNIRVGEQSQAGDPGLVTAYGPGLEGGLTGDTARGGTWLSATPLWLGEGSDGDVTVGWWHRDVAIGV